MKVVSARLSADRHLVVCGACGRTLCRRDRTPDPVGLEATIRVATSQRPSRSGFRFVLAWDTDWHKVPMTLAQPAFIERSAAAMDRLAKGNAPTRRGTDPGAPADWPRQRARYFPDYPPARCPWATCDALNAIDPKRLDIAPKIVA